jgi:iron complex transport system ATP-binding protein
MNPPLTLTSRTNFLVLSMVKRIARENGIGVIMSLHDPNHAILFSDTVALMKNGSIFAVGPSHLVITKEKIETVYEISVRVINHTNGFLVAPSMENFS